MEDVMKRYQVPAFGHWNFSFYDDGIPITQYFESNFCGADDGDLFKFKVMSHCKSEEKTKIILEKGDKGGKKMSVQERERKKAKAVDEDLYKIPRELLYPAAKKKKNMLRKFCVRCLCFNCIA